MKRGKIVFNAIILLSTLTLYPAMSFAAKKVSFSGKVTGNVGCLEILPAPIQNAKLKIYEDESCMINALPKKSVSSSSCIDSTLTDASGSYRFANLDPDSFECSSIIAEASANGYFKQRRYIFPGKDSLLYFSLLQESGDSIYRVFVTVYAVDTTAHCAGAVHCSPQPLGNCRIAVADPLLSWLYRVKDTTDVNGKTEFTLSAVPKVDYLIIAQPVSGSAYYAEKMTNIAVCMGNDVTMNIHLPRLRTIQKPAYDNRIFSIECLPSPFHSGTVIKIQSSSFVVDQGKRIFMRLYNAKGALIGCFNEDTEKSIAGHFFSSSWNVGNIPGGVYLLKMKMGNKAASQKLFIPK